MKIAEADILVLLGEDSAEPGHWQRRWGERFSTGRLVEQPQMARPDLKDWVATIEHHVMMATRPVILIAHSLSVSALVHAAHNIKDTKVRGAFLVSALDHEGPDLPEAARGFGHVPRDPLPFPSMLLTSSNDPFCSVERAVDMATAWGADPHFAPDAGHINVASGHGPWPEGLMMFTRLMQRLH